MICPTDLQLSEFLHGRLDEELSLQIEQHFESCVDCNSRVASLDMGSHTISLKPPGQADSKFDFIDEPECLQLQEFAKDLTLRAWPHGEKSTLVVEDEGRSRKLPQKIDHFRILERIGAGSFGVVLKCWDEELDRPVAMKVSHPSRMKSQSDAERYQLEAKLLAKMGHPNIVPVHATGLTDDGQVYIVSRFIQGRNLAQILKAERFRIETSVRLIAKVAEAIHHMHSHGILHRDIKPGNILIDVNDVPYVTDFGLAIHEDEVVRYREIAGTLAYMSPEQLSGDGHLIVARSDIFSLGVVLFEMLTGIRPFGDRLPGNSTDWIKEVPVPSDFEPNVPVALDRICRKALQIRSSDRHTSAREFQIELEKYLENPEGQLEEDEQVVRVYRGLRSFRKDDAKFFSELLPGLKSSEGYPQQVQFWINRIDGRDPDCEPRIGVIYGATGSGKSSLVNAALIPNLSGIATPILVQASARRTEADLGKQLKKVFLDLESIDELPELTRRIRKRPAPHANQKIVIVIDQFEQWLQGRQIDSDLELVQALRQCDGHSIQCILILRDDFYVDLSQFMRAVDASLNEEDNAMSVPEFTLEHAKTVLTKFGTLLKKGGENDPEKNAFIDRGIELIQANGRIAPVWLSLFVEITKELPWNAETIGQLDDFKTLGQTYLQRRFDPDVCPRRYRSFIPAIKKLLEALLPERENNLKGQGLSLDELRDACEYQQKPERFSQLIEILDNELRIISPDQTTGPDDQELIKYQLTHDYLVPSIRSWLDEEGLRTHAGRAKQKLRDRASLWSLKKESRQLPGPIEAAYIRSGTTPAEWSSIESDMMKASVRKAGIQTAVVCVLAAVFGVWVMLNLRLQRDDELIVQLEQSNMEHVPKIAELIENRFPRMEERVLQKYESFDPGSIAKARFAMPLVGIEDAAAEELKEQIPTASFENFQVLTEYLIQHEAPFDSLNQQFRNVSVSSNMRFQTACALMAASRDDPVDEELEVAIHEAVVAGLIQKSGASLENWTNWLIPYQKHLTGKLKQVFESQNSHSDREKAAFILSQFLKDNPVDYSEFLLHANDQQLAILIDGIVDDPDEHLKALQKTKLKFEKNPESFSQEEITNLLAAFIHLGEKEYPFSHFRRHTDPSIRSKLIHKLAGSRVNPHDIFPHVVEGENPELVAALLQTLGTIEPHHLSTDEQDELKEMATKLFLEHPDPEVHSSSQWVLKQFGESPSVPSITEKQAEEIEHGWYTTPSGFTMIVTRPEDRSIKNLIIPEDGAEYVGELSVNRRFGMSATEVTLKQYQEYKKRKRSDEAPVPAPDTPATRVDFEDALRYCNWLTKMSGMSEADQCYHEVKGIIQPRPDYLERKGYRLPTESEWELMTRGGSSTLFPFGASIEFISEYAWHLENSDSQTHLVGTKKPNQFGFFDVCGNVAEWCHNEESVLENLTKSKYVRIAEPSRGGSFKSHPASGAPYGSMRSGDRITTGRKGGIVERGFRIARTLGQIEKPEDE